MCVAYSITTHYWYDRYYILYGHLSGSRVAICLGSRVVWLWLDLFDRYCFDFDFVFGSISVWFWFSLLFDSHLTSPHLRSSCVYEVCNYLSRTKRKTDYLIASVLALKMQRSRIVVEKRERERCVCNVYVYREYIYIYIIYRKHKTIIIIILIMIYLYIYIFLCLIVVVSLWFFNLHTVLVVFFFF